MMAIMIIPFNKREQTMQSNEIGQRLYGGEFGDTLEQLKARIPFTKDMQGLGFDGDARKVGAVLCLAGVAGELIEHIEQLTAELESVRSMTAMLNEREWAEHVGKGVIAQGLEQAITGLHGELSAARDDGCLIDFVIAFGFDDELAEHLEVKERELLGDIGLDELESAGDLRKLVVKLYEYSKEIGLWPRAEVPA